MTLEEARRRRYGNKPYVEGRCVARVVERRWPYACTQCTRKVADGTLYCRQHQRRYVPFPPLEECLIIARS